MVLVFDNVVTVYGGSEELRERFLTELQDYGSRRDTRLSEEENSTKVNFTSEHGPMDNALLDLAPKYLALDFKVLFKVRPDTLLGDWEGSFDVVDQVVYFADKYDVVDGIELGSVYTLKAKGGFPFCMEDSL